MSSSSLNGVSHVTHVVGKDTGSGFRLCFCCSSNDSNEEQDDSNIPKPRGCTDVVYLIFYVLFCCVMIIIAGFALVYGNPFRLINGIDSFGNVCGTTNENFGNMSFSGLDMRDKPYVFFFNVKNMERSFKICVEQCPDRDLENLHDIGDYFEGTDINLCRYDFNLTKWKEESKLSSRAKIEDKMYIQDIVCPTTPYYASHAVLKRCIPQNTTKIGKEQFWDMYAYLNNVNNFKQILGDLVVTWVTVLGLTGVAFVISFSMIVLIHWITSCLSHLILLIAAVLSVGFTAFLWWTYADIKAVLDSKEEEMILEEWVKNERAFLTYSILATIFTVALLLVIFHLRKRVGIIVQLFRESGYALCAMPCLIIQPFLTYLALAVYYCGWLYIVLCLATADHVKLRKLSMFTSNDSSISSHPYVEDRVSNPEAHTDGVSKSLNDLSTLTLIEYSEGSWVKYMWWIYILGLIWVSEFILGCQQMVIASSVASWYFSRNRTALKCVVLESTWRLIKYHIGSVALGSLIITLVKLPRLIMSFSQKILRQGNQWKCFQWLTKACCCCLAWFESCLKYVHHNAYTVIAIQGVDFCPASRLAFAALVQNALQVSAINSIGDFILFLAKCIIASVTGIIAMIIFRYDESLYFYALPVLLTVVFSYFVAHCVISVFEMAVDTVFLCFCEDFNMNDGTPGKEYYAPESLFSYMTVDAMEAVAPGRRSNSSTSKKLPTDLHANPDEIIPMNPTQA